MSWGLWFQVLLRGVWIHVGDGSPPIRGDVLLQGDSIAAIGLALPAPPSCLIIEASGKHLYPGLIGLGTPVGLIEIEAIRATHDEDEVGDFTPEVAAYTAFDVDSRVLPTLRANGILYVESVPKGGVIAGRAAIFRLEGRTREIAVVEPWGALHLYPPSLRSSLYAPPEEQDKMRRLAREKWEQLQSYLEKARRWCRGDSSELNIGFAAMCPYLEGKKPVVWHVEAAEDIEQALRLSLQYNLRSGIAGGSEALKVAALLRTTGTPVILKRTHRLPPHEDAPLDYAYTLPRMLLDSGVTVMLAHESFWNQRNLSYQAGTAVAYGTPPEQALAMLTSLPAQWLGLHRIGKIAIGYKASLLLCEGDLLDIPSSRILRAWIEGKEIDLLDNPQERLYRKYR
ncbi:MAG: amidohydrolase family protein [Bacteroidia bacterium]|nr:amidohydrolase family protein [Bacteroidia bacterium]MDW8015021.1 amidohydrolase family protein [Bacteroidia bacterium]